MKTTAIQAAVVECLLPHLNENGFHYSPEGHDSVLGKRAWKVKIRGSTIRVSIDRHGGVLVEHQPMTPNARFAPDSPDQVEAVVRHLKSLI